MESGKSITGSRSNGDRRREAPAQAELKRAFPAEATALRDVRRFILDGGARASVPTGALGDLMIAASEACANAVLHSESSAVEVRLVVTDDRAEVVIEDGGIFRSHVPVLDPMGPGRGRGIAMMMALMDEVAVRRGTADQPGTLVRLVKYVP